MDHIWRCKMLSPFKKLYKCPFNENHIFLSKFKAERHVKYYCAEREEHKIIDGKVIFLPFKNYFTHDTKIVADCYFQSKHLKYFYKKHQQRLKVEGELAKEIRQKENAGKARPYESDQTKYKFIKANNDKKCHKIELIMTLEEQRDRTNCN